MGRVSASIAADVAVDTGVLVFAPGPLGSVICLTRFGNASLTPADQVHALASDAGPNLPGVENVGATAIWMAGAV